MVKFKKKKFTQSQLFARLDAEGKGEEARAFFEQVYSDEMRKRRRYRGVKAKIASDIAVIATAKKFPPDPRAEWRIKMAKEREHELVVVKDENAKLKAKQQFEDKLKAQREAAKDLRDSYVVQALKDKTDCAVGDLPEPIAWALSHIHEIHDSEDPSKWDIHPSLAPSAAHWNLLMYAVRRPNEFMETAVKEMLAAQKRKEDRQATLEAAQLRASQVTGKQEKIDPATDTTRKDDGIDKLEALLRKTLESGNGLNTDTVGTDHIKT